MDKSLLMGPLRNVIAVLGALSWGCAGDLGAAGAPGEAGIDGGDGAEGSEGSNGTNGVDGVDGADGMDVVAVEVSGVVATSGGNVGAGVPVTLVAIDDRGESIGTMGGAFTDASGAFAVSVAEGVMPSTRLLLQSVSSEGVLASLLDTTDAVVVDPVSTGVFAAVVLITETDGERTLEDFTPAEIGLLRADAQTTLDTQGTDLSDAAAVLSDILSFSGGLVADYSGGAVTAEADLGLAPPDELDSALANPNGLDVFSSGTAMFDVHNGLGALVEGSAANGLQTDACDLCFILIVNGEAFAAPAAAARVIDYADGSHALSLGEASLSGLTVAREIWIDPTRGLARYADSYRNDGGTAVTVDLVVTSDLGSDGFGVIVDTSSGDKAADLDDRWILVDDDDPSGSDPALAIWWGDDIDLVIAGPSIDLDENLDFAWNGVVVPAGAEVSFVYWAALAENDIDYVDMATLMDGLPADLSALAQLDAAAYANNVSFAPTPVRGLLGGAGSVASFADVTLSNVTAGGSLSLSARSDGSFAARHLGAAGDEIQLDASDGSDAMYTLP